MALSLSPSPALPKALVVGLHGTESLPAKNHRAALIKFITKRRYACHVKSASQPESATDEDPSLIVSSARAQLDLLEQLTSSTTDNNVATKSNEPLRPTIRQQLVKLIDDRNEEFTLPLGKRLKEGLKRLNSATISQRRNIKRQALLNKVGGRNDARFFAIIGAFVLVPPFVVLAIAVSTGYVDLLP